MHPQIRQNEPGKCPICGMDLIPLAARSGFGETSPFVYSMSPEAIALANVQTQQVKFVVPEHEVFLTGKVAINEQKIAVITANYSGRIEELFVDFTGQPVEKGQKLASIYSPELVTAQQELIEAAKFKDLNPALYNAAKDKLRFWKLTETQINNIESSGAVSAEFDVYADRSGVVIRRDIAKGDFVSRGQVLFETADLSKVWVLLDAYESDLPLINVGQRITITVASLPGKEFVSGIAFIDPLINPQTRTAAVRAELNNPRLLLKPEMFVNGRVKSGLSLHEKSLVIPKSSLLWTGKRSVVYVKVPDAEFPAFEMREITLGTSLGEYYQVVSGLVENEEIVTHGVFAIDGAAQLSGNYSMMNRQVSRRIAVPEKFTEQLSQWVDHYFDLKNHLVNSDFEQTRSTASIMQALLAKIDMSILDEDAHTIWMDHHKKLKEYIDRLKNAGDIESQRTWLSPLSDQLVETVEIFGVSIETVFVTFCPMALDDEGAYWLSEIEEVNNPYFGDKMLRCGVVEKTIRSR